MISIKKNNEIKLNIPKFSCDNNAVGEHLMEHPLTELLNVYGFTCLIGRPGSGKSSMAISLMTQKNPKIYRKTHHHVVIMIPSNSIGSLKKNPFDCLPSENIYNELNDRTISQVYTNIDKASSVDEKTLLFIDDMTADLKKSKIIIETLKRMIYNRRHLKLNIIITAQSYVNMPLDIRKNITNLILFKPPKKEMQLIFDEMIESKKELFGEVMKIAYDEKHNFLFINIPSQRMFKNWDELIFREEDESDSDNEIEK
jgi:ABC-type dipeptide/oligopeptide/nickel transport system ATPase component